MTEKRFKHLLNAIGMQFICYDDKEILMGTFADADGVAYIVELLNELYKENTKLKEALKELKEIGDYQADRIKELQEFEDTVFNLLDDKIKRGEKAIEWGESIGVDIGSMGFHIELLKQFKKELEE